VAGQFYAADPVILRRAVQTYMGVASSGAAGSTPKAIIAPHAGYQYSGPVAASAYATLAPARGTVTRLLVAGVAHRIRVAGVAVSSASAFATPLGPVDVDTDARRRALAIDGVVVDDCAHADEHSVEVQLPFIVEVLGSVNVLPMVLGSARAEVLADVLDALWGGDETRIVVSTDLSHYHDEATARALDRETAAMIVERRDTIAPEQACGAAALRGLAIAAVRHDLRVEMLDLRTSADTAGTPDRVVGYGAFALWERQVNIA
jgi:hypothetical protein